MDWTLDGTSFSSLNDPIYTGATLGYHFICALIVDFNCLSNPTTFICDTVYVSGIIGISEKDLAKTVDMYPNPSTGKVNIVSSYSSIENVLIYNALGQILLEEKNPRLKNELDLHLLPTGIYIVKTKTEAGIVTEKLTINK